MSPEADGPDTNSSAILRAVGSLLVALGGSEEKAMQRIARGVGTEALPAGTEAASAPVSPTVSPATVAGLRADDRADLPPSDDPDAEVELILADARERAQRILDESMERARALVESRQAPVGASEQAVREVRAAVSELTVEVRAVQQRLDRIEALLREGRATAPAAPSAPAPPVTGLPPIGSPAVSTPLAPTPAPTPPRAPGFSVAQSPAVEPATTGRPVPPPLPAQPPQPGDLPGVPRSAVPPVRPAAPPPVEDAGGLGDEDGMGDEDEGAPIATFLPDEGTLILRVTPVSGFQGLMRVQDALARLPYVRHAAVEAYSQGEARLRVELTEATDSEEIAAGLGERLQEPAYVRSASEADRELLIALR